jgi:hypothetical protein
MDFMVFILTLMLLFSQCSSAYAQMIMAVANPIKAQMSLRDPLSSVKLIELVLPSLVGDAGLAGVVAGAAVVFAAAAGLEVATAFASSP